MERKHTRFLTLLVSLLVLVSVLTTTVFAEDASDIKDPVCYVHGDLNGDGMIGTSDAIYVLYYSMLGDLYPDRYPINQDCDFYGNDGKVSTKDALYLLYASHELEGYELSGVIHDYYDPYWSWDTNTFAATLTVRCGCGQKHELVAEPGVDVTHVTTDATCVAAGSTVYTAKITYEGEEYTDTYTQILPISGDGHVMVGTQGCETGSECELCDYELPALGHNWVLNEELSTAATCTTQAVQHYDCTVCGGSKDVTIEGTLSHVYEYVEGGDHLVDGTTCTYVKTYDCATCDSVIDGTAASDTYDKHTYTVTLTKEANCHTAGEKTYTCTVENCGNTYTEPVDANGVHVWNDGVTEKGVTTYTCKIEGCGATKTAVAVTEGTAVSKDQLSNELELENGASVSLDANAAAGLKDEKEIKISVGAADLSATGLTDAQKEQVGDNTVYDFNMTYVDGDDDPTNDEAVTNFNGTVTISLPYTLEGEDIDSIDVWYIDDQGQLTQVYGTYSNGYVTFETDHFSYYTVTRLTPAERCARYGHIWVSSEKAATCTEGGYNMQVCQRCGGVDESSKEIIPARGHDYEDTSNAKVATCTDAGWLEQKCTRCDHLVAAELPALGHNLKKDEERSKDATCDAPGEYVYVCTNADCDHEQKEDKAQLKHVFENHPLETVYPDCTTGGHDHQKCDLCGQDIVSNSTNPLGHNFAVAENGWTWNEDRTAVTVDLVCRNNSAHTKQVKAVISEKVEAATCTGSGYVLYTATISHNGNTFTESVMVNLDAVGHQTSGDWEHNSNKHYRVCSVCGEKADMTDHNWVEVNVTKQPTCNEAGSADYNCIVCGYAKTEALPATGVHDLVDGTCSDCGFTEDTCDHMKLRQMPLDLSAYNVCAGLEFVIERCECGEKSVVYLNNSACNWVGQESGMAFSQTCVDCGVTYTEKYDRVYDDANCTGYYVIETAVSIGDTVLAESTLAETQYPQKHPVHVEGESVDLGSLGLCEGGTATKISCACGKAYYHEIKHTCTTDENGLCSACGAQWGFDGPTHSQDGCYSVYSFSQTAEKDGQVIAAFGEKYYEANHNYVVKDFVLDGESCEDGVLIHRECSDCGAELSGYYTHHMTAVETITDLTGYDSCAPAVSQYVCCCDEEKSGYEGTFGNPANHNWSLVSEDTETGITVHTCSDCNYTRTIKTVVGEKNEDCAAERLVSHTFADDNGHTYSYVDQYTGTDHNYELEYELEGSSCTDGVTLKQICADCGHSYTMYHITEHMGMEQAYYDLTEYGLCGGSITVYGCPCGEAAWTNEDYSNRCNWQYIDGDWYNSIYVCPDCGVTRSESVTVLSTIDECHQNVKVSIIFTKNDQELLKIEYYMVMDTHSDVYTFVLQDSTKGCDGGYDVTRTCKTCGYTNTWTGNYGHNYYPIAREVVSVNQLCGDLELVTYSCPCSSETWVNYEWENGSCDFRWNGENGVCVGCGAVLKESTTWKDIEGETCKKQGIWNVTIIRNGNVVCDYSYEATSYDHEEETVYSLKGSTCAEGYTYSTICSKCNEVLVEQSEVRYDCNVRTVETITPPAIEGMCGPITMEIASCACGKEKHVRNNWDCEFDHIGWDEDRECSKYQCRNCGVIWYDDQTYEHIPNTCTATSTYNWIFELNGTPATSFQGTYVVTDHRNIASFNMYGDTCEDGYDVSITCAGCGKTANWGTRYGHETFNIGYYNLADYGMCGGEYFIYGCPCGQEQHYGWNYEVCQWNHQSYDDSTRTSTYYCSGCKTTRTETNAGQRDKETCTYTGTTTITFVRNSQTVLTFTVNQNHESHDMMATDLVLSNPDGGCEDGVTVTETCADCGYGYTNTYYDHRCFETLNIDLSDGCGGVLRFGACACGQDEYFSQEYNCRNMVRTWDDWTDDDGIYHNHYIDTCADCGLTIEDDWYTVRDEGSCNVTTYETYTVTYGTETYVHERQNTWQNHDCLYTSGTLVDGATSCEDGVDVTWKCKDCGAIGTYYGVQDHHMIIGESIDLGDYGSLCGGTLDLYTCACGKHQRYDIGADTQCDLDRKYTDHWISDVLNVTQDTSEGYICTYSDAYTLKCAVTDPEACGLTIRMAEYWLNENCLAVEYQTWQLGYNEADGTCLKEITIKTGDSHAYHPYTESYINETLDDGSVVTGTQWTCPDCGSYAYHRNTHLNGIYTKFECLYVNTLYETNGENQRRSDTTEYGLVANGYTYESSYRWEEVDADGTVTWHQNEFSNYDFSNGDCKRTVVYTDSNGNTDTRVESAHVVGCQEYDSIKPTCTQDGERVHTHTCQVCGWVDWQERWQLDPTCHNWNWDDTKQTYVCSVCELESAVGATGSIAMEDLTADTDTEYKIGYWNQNDIEFTPQVCVILDDATTDDNLLVLTGITFDYLTVKEDGVRALTFNKEEVQAAAEAAMANVSYTGSYAIRIVFNPTSGEHTLDYAITFDSQNTAQ